MKQQRQINVNERKRSLRPPQLKTDLVLNKNDLKPIIRYGHWGRSENLKYKQFLRENYHIIKNLSLRYHCRIFIKMAQRIGTRNALQCKSHHQKMLHKFNNSIQNLIFCPEPNQRDKLVNICPKQHSQWDYEEIIQGVKKVETSKKNPWFMVEVNSKIVIVIDARFISSF